MNEKTSKSQTSSEIFRTIRIGSVQRQKPNHPKDQESELRITLEFSIIILDSIIRWRNAFKILSKNIFTLKFFYPTKLLNKCEDRNLQTCKDKKYRPHILSLEARGSCTLAQQIRKLDTGRDGTQDRGHPTQDVQKASLGAQCRTDVHDGREPLQGEFRGRGVGKTFLYFIINVLCHEAFNHHVLFSFKKYHFQKFSLVLICKNQISH